nr:ribonuclease H-like domain-containing protein [Tanacetum cinerariifolium]
MIKGLDRRNEVIEKHLQEYEQAEADLTVGEKIELINELVKYEDHHAKILKYQAQQSKPLSKKEQREFYMSVLRSHAKWKTRHFIGMTLEEIKEKFILISEDVSEEDLKGMIQLVPLEEVYVEALQLWTLVKETLSIRQATKDKEKELWVELKRLFEPDFEYQLWTHNQAFMHDPLEWKLYETCGVHHVFPKDQEMFMLVEKDYPLRKGLTTVMICNKLQVEQYSQMANDLILNIHSIARIKDETGGTLKSFITRVENLMNLRVKVIRCDNETEFKNKEMNQFCEVKGKFDGKADKGFFVGYSLNSKASRVFNSRTRIMEENLHVRFSENTPNHV